MRTRKTLGGGLAAILLLILTQLIAQGAAGLLAMIKQMKLYALAFQNQKQ